MHKAEQEAPVLLKREGIVVPEKTILFIAS